MNLPNNIDLKKLGALLIYSDRYEISVQFWPDQIAVYIEKDGVGLQDFGGSFSFAVGRATEYLNRINKKPKYERNTKAICPPSGTGTENRTGAAAADPD